MKKISVIIPCYNAIASIDSCLESIVNQTIGLENIEVILVNDASTDATLDKLCEWESKYEESIIVINCMENGKQGRARNIGLQYATGEYIGFMDDDDIVNFDMYSILYQAAKKHQCDLVVCQSVKQNDYIIENNQRSLPEDDEIITIITLDERQKLLERDINIAIWNKLYKRELLLDNEIYFLEGFIYDDIFFSALVKCYCTKLYISKKILYYHIISDLSVSYDSKNLLNRIGFIEVHILLIEELRNRGFYELFPEWYEKEFFIDYLAFITNFEKTFKKMDDTIYNVIKKNVLKLFPNYLAIPLVKRILYSDDKLQYKKILMELENNM